MNASMGFSHFWHEADAVSHGVAYALLLMSLVSWFWIFSKARMHWRHVRQHDFVLADFWSATSRSEAINILEKRDVTGAFSHLAKEAFTAAHVYEQEAMGKQTIGSGVDLNEFIARTLQQSQISAQARIERGLTVLASVGSTAPYIGLLGTVWGIYHALTGLSGETQVVLDKVAGPVGEALIMTAAGLFVAIPAVLAYNAFTRTQRLTTARLEGFAHALHAYLVSGVRLER